ncbi:hypothetical protein B4110_0053 [Parageobacillus toebii]|uniref:Uncharacterized protein n=1 Tax=Parageobacillus toebii TaxID=153151 RepID=A0A150N6R7_9BACL|nr:hypothetical protein B4110_0053 [Parageobacillus toebii]
MRNLYISKLWATKAFLYFFIFPTLEKTLSITITLLKMSAFARKIDGYNRYNSGK